MGRRQQQYLLVNEDDENNERPSLGGEEGGESSLQQEEQQERGASSSSSSRLSSFSTPRRTRSYDSSGALTASTASLNDYYSDDDFDVEDFMATEATDDDDDDDDVDDHVVVDIDLAATGNDDDDDDDDDDLYVWGRTIQVQAPCALPNGYVFTVDDAINGQQLLVEVPEFGVAEGQIFAATIVHVVDETNNDIDYERMYNLDPATRTSQLKQQQQKQAPQNSTAAQRQAKQQRQQQNRKRNNKRHHHHGRRRVIPRGAWRNGIFQGFEHGLRLHLLVLCLACWCCSPLLLGQVLTRMKLDACGNNAVVKQQQQKTTGTDKREPSPPFWNNAFYTMTLLLALHVVLIEHVLSAFIIHGLSVHYDGDDAAVMHHHPTWVWLLLLFRATCRCYFLVYMVYLTMKTRRHIRQKYQIQPVYCRPGSGSGMASSSCCRCPCRRRRLHVDRSKQEAATASDDGVVLGGNDHDRGGGGGGGGGACEDCCCATLCNCCTIVQMARHTVDSTSYRSTFCTPNGL